VKPWAPLPGGLAALVGAALEVAPSALGVLALMAVVEAWVRIVDLPVYVVPTPSAMLARLSENLLAYMYELQFTLLAAAGGLVLGSTIGICGAVLMANWRVLEKSLFPLAVLVKLTPFVAIVPLLVIWLGYNIWPKIAIATLITFFPVLVNCITGFRAADPLAVDFFRSVGASTSEVFRLLRWPSSLPYLFASLKVTVNLSLTGAIVGEYFGTDHGIGKVIFGSLEKLDMRSVFAGVVVLALTGVLLTVLSNTAERRLLFWHESSRAEV
jgi:NitT/TauT family transport system permease protein